MSEGKDNGQLPGSQLQRPREKNTALEPVGKGQKLWWEEV